MCKNSGPPQRWDKEPPFTLRQQKSLLCLPGRLWFYCVASRDIEEPLLPRNSWGCSMDSHSPGNLPCLTSPISLSCHSPPAMQWQKVWCQQAGLQQALQTLNTDLHDPGSESETFTNSKAIEDRSVPYTMLTSQSEGFLQQLLCLGKQDLDGRV